MSDPIASVSYEPNEAPTPDAPLPAGGDPSRLQAAIAADLEPWQRRLLDARMHGKTTESLSQLRTAMGGISAAVSQASAILGSANLATALDELDANRARVSRTWAEYHRRRA